ncbi:hypothetical protein AB7783_07225 [Tardiphaga sp. 172_B4_N1_3]|uniref:hypothetical protein n=1 Tax=Tardiphaga sp. 172_B4_N1_3 TaxID=3240787 RepID=UPI003F8BB668
MCSSRAAKRLIRKRRIQQGWNTLRRALYASAEQDWYHHDVHVIDEPGGKKRD